MRIKWCCDVVFFEFLQLFVTKLRSRKAYWYWWRLSQLSFLHNCHTDVLLLVFLEPPLVNFSINFLVNLFLFSLHCLHRDIQSEGTACWSLVLFCFVHEIRHIPLERHFLIVVNVFFLFQSFKFLLCNDVLDACHLQLSCLLQLSQPPSLINNLLSLFSLGLLTFRICQSNSDFSKHLLLVLIHINRVWPCWLRLRIWVDFSRTQLPQVIRIIWILALSNIE